MIKFKGINIPKIMLATSNKGKVHELRELFSDIPVEIVSIKDFFGNNLPEEPEENAETFAGNAKIKAAYYAKLSGIPCIADDSGLLVSELNGAPGLYSHRFAATETNPNPTDDDKNKKLIELLHLNGLSESDAEYYCAVTLVVPKSIGVACNYEFPNIGSLYGKFKDAASGTNGFSFDKHFYLKEYDYKKTAADISPGEKNKISHRAVAMNRLKDDIKRFFKFGG